MKNGLFKRSCCLLLAMLLCLSLLPTTAVAAAVDNAAQSEQSEQLDGLSETEKTAVELDEQQEEDGDTQPAASADLEDESTDQADADKPSGQAEGEEAAPVVDVPEAEAVEKEESGAKEDDGTVTVRFMALDQVVETRKLKAGDEIVRPADPKLDEGYRFDGWFTAADGAGRQLFVTDADGDGVIDPETVNIDEGIAQVTVYAKVTKTVRYSFQVSGVEVASQVVADGDKLNRPEDPETEENVRFDGWFVTENGAERQLFAAGEETVTVTEDSSDVTVWAKLTKTVGYPAFSERAQLDGVTINVTAEEGTFPEYASLYVRRVSVQQREAAEAAVDATLDPAEEIVTQYIFDISVVGNGPRDVLQPEDGHTAKISFTYGLVGDSEMNTQVHHINSETGEAEPLTVSESGNVATVETGGFSA